MSIEPLFCAALQTNKSPLLTIDIEGITDTQTALIDSGSSANFIDPQFARSHSIPLIELDSPHSVIGINGKQVRNPICFKAWLVFSSQNRQFSAIFYALPLGNRILVFGTPLLKLVNPDIDWITMNVSLCLATEAQAGSINPEPQNLPVEFQELQKVFSEEFFTTLPEHRPYDIAIDLEEDKQPPYGPIYSMTPAEREALKEHTNSELATGKIVPTTSPAGAPVMFVKRADGRLCSVVDYCWLNAITIKNRYALPSQDKLIEKLRHASIFTKLDLRNGYHNIRIKEGDEWKAAFCTALGHFAPTVMQFGLSNTLAVFMLFMNNIFCDLLDISVVVYLDDILVSSNSREEHVEHVKAVLSCLLKHNLFCNPAKCYFFVTEVTYIGLVITPDGISTEKDKVQAIMDWPEPQNVKQVQSFLGFANFYRCSVPNFSCLACSLNNLTQKEQPWIWLEEQKAAFDAIKAEICKEPVVAHPDKPKPYTLETDASGAAMGAVLSQRKENGCLHPVAFMLASSSPAELNYDTHDKELLAIICAFEDWRIFLEGTEQPITVLTDHKNLEYWKSARTFNRCLARWHLMLVSYNFVIAY
ncbi:K02A2.6-like, partial [Rhizoctonia solani]